MEVDCNVPFFIEFIYVIGLQRVSCVLRLQGLVSEVDNPHTGGVIAGGHGGTLWDHSGDR